MHADYFSMAWCPLWARRGTSLHILTGLDLAISRRTVLDETE
jgi:hypothetical protein